MSNNLRVAVIGALALAGSAIATADAQAMPVQDLNSTASSLASSIDHIWWRGGYGYGYRRFGYGYGWRRPFYGYRYGWRRPYYGWRRW